MYEHFDLGSGSAKNKPSHAEQDQNVWETFGNTTFTASVGTHQLLTFANIQPMTLQAGIALASHFKFGERWASLRCIQGMKQIMESALEVDVKNAITAVDRSIASLREFCNCLGCSGTTEELQDICSDKPACLTGIAYTIRDIARTMAYVVQYPSGERNILPTVEGIKSFHSMGCGRGLHCNEGLYVSHQKERSGDFPVSI